MPKWVGLLRGINVGGKNRLPMEGLRDICTALWPESQPKTLIASGNLIIKAPDSATTLATDLGAAIKEVYGIDVPVLMFAESVFRKSVAGCPFGNAEGKGVHGFFCFTPAQIDPQKRDALMDLDEGMTQDGNMIWLHTPQGISKSKLAEKLGQVIGHVPTTARNLNTLRRIVEMLDETD